MPGLARYGVFLRPDPLTCATVTRITAQLRAQYGLVSAAAFPPHATLAGSLPLAGGPEPLLAVLDDVLRTTAPFEVHNAGVGRMHGGLIFKIHTLAGAPNAALIELAAAVTAAARRVVVAVPSDQLPADIHPPERWVGHLSLASHDLADRPDLIDEVEAYIHGLQVPHPTRFSADTVVLYRFQHTSWTGAWWRELQWQHVRSWRLSSESGTG
jgi:hypothetical protein